MKSSWTGRQNIESDMLYSVELQYELYTDSDSITVICMKATHLVAATQDTHWAHSRCTTLAECYKKRQFTLRERRQQKQMTKRTNE